MCASQRTARVELQPTRYRPAREAANAILRRAAFLGRRPKPPRPRKPKASIAHVEGSGIGELGEPAGSPCVTTTSSDVGVKTSFRRTPPPQVHESLGLAMLQAAPSSE